MLVGKRFVSPRDRAGRIGSDVTVEEPVQAKANVGACMTKYVPAMSPTRIIREQIQRTVDLHVVKIDHNVTHFQTCEQKVSVSSFPIRSTYALIDDLCEGEIWINLEENVDLFKDIRFLLINFIHQSVDGSNFCLVTSGNDHSRSATLRYQSGGKAHVVTISKGS